MGMFKEPTGTEIMPRADIVTMVATRDRCLAHATTIDSSIMRANELAAAVAPTSPGRAPKLWFFVTGNNNPSRIEDYRKILDAAAWHHVLTVTRIRDLMGAQQREDWEKKLETDPPEFTIESVVATFENLAGRSDEIFRQSLVDVFEGLPRSFGSHDGLAFRARCVLTHAVSKYPGGYSWHFGSARYDARGRVNDLDRAFHRLGGKKWTDSPNPDALEKTTRAVDLASAAMRRDETECETEFMKLRWFGNGNMHVWLTDKFVVSEANRILGEHYGSRLGQMHLHPNQRAR